MLAENLRGTEKTLRREDESRRHRREAPVHGSHEKVARGGGRRPPANLLGFFDAGFKVEQKRI